VRTDKKKPAARLQKEGNGAKAPSAHQKQKGERIWKKKKNSGAIKKGQGAQTIQSLKPHLPRRKDPGGGKKNHYKGKLRGSEGLKGRAGEKGWNWEPARTAGQQRGGRFKKHQEKKPAGVGRGGVPKTANGTTTPD